VKIRHFVLFSSLTVLAPQVGLGQTSGHKHPTGQSAALPIEIGAVIAPLWQSGEQSLLHREKGLGLGHSDVSIDGRLGSSLRGRLSAAAHSDHARIETGIEEAFIEASLPGSLQVRGGRFLSQVGYLNEQHSHADDFSLRPAAYRAFLGDHYFDDGVRLNWVAPTSFYWRLGGEALRGKRLPTEPAGSSLGAWTLGTRLGGDLGAGASWQAGVSTLRHRSGALGMAGDAEHHGDHDHDDHLGALSGHHAAHSHGATFFGRRIDAFELVWKWAPDGNARARQARVSAEYLRVSAAESESGVAGRHSGWYLSAVYRFMPQWEVGVRIDRVYAMALHEDGFEPARLLERSLMLAWKPSHSRALRVQWTQQRDRGGFADAVSVAPANAVHLQFVQSFGAHGAHSY
jgi:hypothetical protein